MLEGLQADILKAAMVENSHVDIGVVVHEVIDSTSSWCLRQSKAGKSLPFACFAEQQTQGRGRRGKEWLMPACSNIALSIAWPFTLSYQQLHLLPLSVAIAIAELLEDFGIKHVQIKWPNDIYVRHKKIAGILIETQPVKSEQEGGRRVAVVIGIGLNYDMSGLDKKIQKALMPTDISYEAESQSLESKPERVKVASLLLQNIVDVCQNYQQVSKRCLNKFSEHYDYCKDKNVEVILDNEDILTGVAQGVNENAELLVLIDGQQHTFNSAEVSVRA